MAMSRRMLLRGSVAGLGVTMGLPVLEAMLDSSGTALAHGGAIPTRFGVWFWGNGTILSEWIPDTVGPDWTAPRLLQPFAAAGVQSSVRVLTGLGVPFDDPAVHDIGRAAVLSGTWDPAAQPADYAGAPTGPSVDQIAADHIGGETIYRSLEIGVSTAGNGAGAVDAKSVSWVDPLNVLPAEFSPSMLFHRLFVDGYGGDELLRQTRLSVLDAVAQDAEALRTKLGAADAQRLEAHLDGVRALEIKVGATPPDCTIPTNPGDPIHPSPGVEPLAERAEAMADLLVMALACDLTRVFDYRFSAVRADTVFTDVGATLGMHPSTHDGSLQNVVADAVQYTMAQMAYLLDRLAKTPEGDGTLLDHCVVLGTSEVAEGVTHGLENIPMLLAGGGSGRLAPGAHTSFAGQSTSRALLTALQAAGVEVDSVGAGLGLATESLPGLLV